MNKESRTFITKLKRERELRGFTQQEVANRSGITQNYIAIFEKLHSKPSIETIINYATAIGIDMFSIFGNSAKKIPTVKKRECKDIAINGYLINLEDYKALSNKAKNLLASLTSMSTENTFEVELELLVKELDVESIRSIYRYISELKAINAISFLNVYSGDCYVYINLKKA